MSEYPVFHFRFENPKTFIQFTFKNNIVDFNLNNEFNIKIDEKKYDLNTIISLKFELNNNEPEIIIDYNIKDQPKLNLKMNDFLSMINELKNKVHNDIDVIENVESVDNKQPVEEIVESVDNKAVEEIVDNKVVESVDNKPVEESVESVESVENVDNKSVNSLEIVKEDKSRLGKVRMERARLEKIRMEKEKLENERLENERLENERLEKNNFIMKSLKKDLETIKDPDNDVIDKALKIQLNMLEHLKLIVSDNPEMIYTNMIHIITELMKYVETINTEDLDKKTLIIKSIKTFLEYQKLNSSETDLILDTVCPELIDVLLLVDKRKIVFKRKLNCFLPWCA
jgi:hypothetical protein